MTRVPALLQPEKFGGYISGLAIYKTDGDPTVSVAASTITVEGSVFTFTEKSLPTLAAEISRALADIMVGAGINTVPLANDLTLYANDVTPDGGTVVRFNGMAIKHTERTRIRLLKPHPETWHAAWWPRINRGTFKTIINGVTYTFGVPEYESQAWSPRLGKPYMEHVQARATVRSTNALQLPRGPILSDPGYITLYKNGIRLNSSMIDDVDENNRTVYTTEGLVLGDRITADYIYKEESYIYHGVNLNPSLGHSPYLVDQFILIYLLPQKSSSGEKRARTVYDVTGPSIESCIGLLPTYLDTPIVVIGALRTRQIEESNDVSVQDARTQGGGVKDSVDAETIEPEAQFYGDIGNIDGRGYPGNSVIISRIPRITLDTFTHDEIMDIARKHVAAGTVTLVDFYD